MTNEQFLRKTKIYYKGRLVNYADATVSVASAPVQYGAAVYTSCNVLLTPHGWVGFRLQDHYRRLVDSANILGMRQFAEHISYSQFTNAISKVVTQNKFKQDIIVRCTYYLDSIMPGTKLHDQPTAVTMFVLPFGDYFDKPVLDVMVSSWRRIPDQALPARAKVNGSYVNSSLMKSEALQNGYDDVIALDCDGHVAEGAVANIFMVRKGVLITPAVSSDILEGITRDTIIEIAQAEGIPYQERVIDRTELYTADELFFSGSSARVWPIRSVDKRPIGNGLIGPLTTRLQKLYSAVQRKQRIIKEDWYEEIGGSSKL